MMLCILSQGDKNFDKCFLVGPTMDHFKQKPFTLLRWLVILCTTHFSFDRVGELTVWVLFVKVVCKAAVWHLVKISEKIDEMKMMKKNALYPLRCHKCQVHLFIAKTNTCFWNFPKQWKHWTTSYIKTTWHLWQHMWNQLSFTPSQVFLWF